MTTTLHSQQIGLQQSPATVSSGIEKRKSWFSWTTKLKSTSTKVIIANPGLAGDKVVSKGTIEVKHILQQELKSDYSSVFPKPIQQSNPIVNILVLGTEHSGSSSLAARFIGQRLCDDRTASRVVAHGNGHLAVAVRVVRNMEDPTFEDKWIKQSNGVVIVCDCSNPTLSVYEAVRWKKMLDAMMDASTTRIILAVNKSDRASGAKATFDQIKDALESNGVQFDNLFPVSALTGLNVEDCFGDILTTLPTA